jgi:hypothetical protein
VSAIGKKISVGTGILFDAGTIIKKPNQKKLT